MGISRVAIVVLAAASAVLPGCTRNLGHDMRVRKVMHAPLDPGIVDVHTYYKNNPFLSFDEEGNLDPEGFKVAYYAISSTTHEGTHGDGIIRFKMFVVRPDAKGSKSSLDLMKTWEFTPEQALGARVTRKTEHLGWPYQFYLNWGDADVYGKEIRIVPEFQRRDGQIIRGSTKSLLVPPRQQDAVYSGQISKSARQ